MLILPGGIPVATPTPIDLTAATLQNGGDWPNGGSNELTVGSVNLQTVIAPVGHVDIAFRVHGHAGGAVEVANAAIGALEFDQELALGCELLHPVVSPVGNVHVVLLV